MSLFIVTVEGIDDGMWFEEPEGYDTAAQAIERSKKLSIPDGHFIAVYRCEVLHTETKEDRP